MHPVRQLQFHYTAKSVEGETVRGTASAPDRSALSYLLHGRGLYLVSAREEPRRRLKNASLAELCRQLSGLMASGVGLVRGLEILSREEGLEEHLRLLCEGLLAQVRCGVSLGEAMEAQQAFPPLLLGMVRARWHQRLHRLARRSPDPGRRLVHHRGSRLDQLRHHQWQ